MSKDTKKNTMSLQPIILILIGIQPIKTEKQNKMDVQNISIQCTLSD